MRGPEAAARGPPAPGPPCSGLSRAAGPRPGGSRPGGSRAPAVRGQGRSRQGAPFPGARAPPGFRTLLLSPWRPARETGMRGTGDLRGVPVGQRSGPGGLPVGDRQEDSQGGMGWGGALPIGDGQGGPHGARRRWCSLKGTIARGCHCLSALTLDPQRLIRGDRQSCRARPPRWGYAFSFQSLRRDGWTGPEPEYHGRVQENSKSLVPLGFMTQHRGCKRGISQTGLEICFSGLVKGRREAPEELQGGVRTVGHIREVSAHKPPLTPHLLCATVVLSLGLQQMAEGRSRGEEISSPQADFATAHQ